MLILLGIGLGLGPVILWLFEDEDDENKAFELSTTDFKHLSSYTDKKARTRALFARGENALIARTRFVKTPHLVAIEPPP